jgi:uncharacterized protein involved in type VI secretion and phage assembly
VTTPISGNGVAVGVVIANDDPERLGRVLVELQAQGDMRRWARVATPTAGQGAGAWPPPAIGQEVVVAFEGGHIDRPIVIGVLTRSP